MGKKEDCDVVVFNKKGLRRNYEINIRKKSAVLLNKSRFLNFFPKNKGDFFRISKIGYLFSPKKSKRNF